MKTKNFLSAIALMIFLGSCKKEHSNLNSQNVPSSNNSSSRLAFSNRGEFEDSIVKLTANHKNARLSDDNFISMLDYYKNKSIYNPHGRVMSDTLPTSDSVFASLISPEGIIQIGENIFKIDIPAKKVLVLNIKDEPSELKNLIMGNKSDKIREFSTDEEVLTLLEEDQTSSFGRIQLFCGGRFASATSDYDDVTYAPGYRLKSKVHYESLGIYFTLEAQATNLQQDLFGIWFSQPAIMTADYAANWTPRCKDPESDANSDFHDTEAILVIRLWQSTRALKNYDFKVIFKNTPSGVKSKLLSISDY